MPTTNAHHHQQMKQYTENLAERYGVTVLHGCRGIILSRGGAAPMHHVIWRKQCADSREMWGRAYSAIMNRTPQAIRDAAQMLKEVI